MVEKYNIILCSEVKWLNKSTDTSHYFIGYSNESIKVIFKNILFNLKF